MANSATLIPTASREVVIGPELGAELERRVFGPAKAAGSELSVVAVTDPPPPVQVQKAPDGSWWVDADTDADPVAMARGGITKAPPEIVDNLRSLREGGVDFDCLRVLHQLPADWEPGTPPPKMELAPIGPSKSAPVVAFQEATFGLAAKVVGAVAAVADATVAAVGDMTLDPVVLGGIKDPESGQIAWVGLAAWDEVPR